MCVCVLEDTLHRLTNINIVTSHRQAMFTRDSMEREEAARDTDDSEASQDNKKRALPQNIWMESKTYFC